jgi:hypothetical protein
MPKNIVPAALAAALVLAGCATSPPPAPKVAYVATDQAEARTLEEARKAGYKIVDEGGTTLYCRNQPKLGTRIQTETICLTREEMLAAREAQQSSFENMKKVLAPPADRM